MDGNIICEVWREFRIRNIDMGIVCIKMMAEGTAVGRE